MRFEPPHKRSVSLPSGRQGEKLALLRAGQGMGAVVNYLWSRRIIINARSGWDSSLRS